MRQSGVKSAHGGQAAALQRTVLAAEALKICGKQTCFNWLVRDRTQGARKTHCVVHQGLGPSEEEKEPEGPSEGRRERRTVSAAPCSRVWVPRCWFMSVEV